MNTRKMFVWAGGECCQCGNVASTNANFQFVCAYATAGNWELATLELATLAHWQH